MSYTLRYVDTQQAYFSKDGNQRKGFGPDMAIGNPMQGIGGNLLNCCGLYSLQNFNRMKLAATFAEKADYLSFLYKYGAARQFLYCLADYQIGKRPEGSSSYMTVSVAVEHQLFLELETRPMGSFKNLQHGPCDCHLFLFNVNNAVGKYLDERGEPLKEDPSLAKPTQPATKKVSTAK